MATQIECHGSEADVHTVNRVTEEGWTHIALPSPVDGPAIKAFLNDPRRKGFYHANQRGRMLMDKLDRFGFAPMAVVNNFYFSDPDTAFEFKMRWR